MHPNWYDPVEDERFPRIVSHVSGTDVEEVFPDEWGSEPTERDQAVIDAIQRDE